MPVVSATLLLGLTLQAVQTVHLDVPLIPREDPYCGPAALAMLLTSRGLDFPMPEIEAAIYTPGLRGSLAVAVTAFLREKNIPFQARQSARVQDVRDALYRGQPVLALIDHGFSIYSAPHYVVVIGAARDRLFINSGDRAGQSVDERTFERRWRRAGSWMLVLGVEES